MGTILWASMARLSAPATLRSATVSPPPEAPATRLRPPSKYSRNVLYHALFAGAAKHIYSVPQRTESMDDFRELPFRDRDLRTATMNEEAEALFAVLRQSASEAVVPAIEMLVREAPDRALCRINALKFAAERDLDEEETIATFLHAARLGI